MINDLLTITRVSISNAELLYPDGIDWSLSAGVNAIIGGTGLGKTTLVYAIQFAIFGKLLAESTRGTERIEKEVFRHRLSSRSAEELKTLPPLAEIWFTVGNRKFQVKRNLLTGTVVEAKCDGQTLKGATYEKRIAETVGLENDFESLVKLQAHLLFFGEGRYLIAWENLRQNEILNLLFSDHNRYLRITELWEKAQSQDSSARNLSAQAHRLEQGLNTVVDKDSNVQELERRDAQKQISELRRQLNEASGRLLFVRQELARERQLLSSEETSVVAAQVKFNRAVVKLEEAADDSLDEHLLTRVITSPTAASVRNSLEQFYISPDSRPCPSCGRVGLPTDLAERARKLAARAQLAHCIICSKPIKASGDGKATKVAAGVDKASTKSAASLKNLLFRREQTKSRIETLISEEGEISRLQFKLREEELNLVRKFPDANVEDSLSVTIKKLRSEEAKAKKAKDKFLRALRKELTSVNKTLEQQRKHLAKAFQRYVALYLDEPCEIQFLQEAELPAKRGAQLKPPHAAFYPVISGQKRQSSQELNYAQQSFVDLAFRMAVLDVWKKRTHKVATLIVESPEGAVDIAYMARVASMLRAFAADGHTLIITTNLNNEIFLPELMSLYAASERKKRILNLLKVGRPRNVQREHQSQELFDKILEKVWTYPTPR